MKKRWLLSLMAALLLLTALVPEAYAEQTEETEGTEETKAEAPASSGAASGSCGDGLSWSLEGGVLTVSGSGAMDAGCPWEDYKDSIRSVVLTGGVTVVGEEAFRECGNLTSVDFGDSLKEVDTRAFQGCDSLTSISMPASFRRFGVESFEGCTQLTEVICTGGMPSFNGNCLWNGGQITVYYPTNNPWPQQPVEELVHNFGGRLEVMAGTGSESRPKQTEPAKETTAPTTAPTTEPTTEPTTVPTAAPTTVPTLPPVTEPATQPATTAATQPTVQTAPAEPLFPVATQPEEPSGKDAGGSAWIGLMLVVMVLSFVLAGALIVRNASHKGGNYED